MSKSQVQMAIVYIFSAIIVLTILGFGYMQLSKSREAISESAVYAFREKLRKDAESMSHEYGSIKKFSYNVPDQVSTVCFSADKTEGANFFPLTCDEDCNQEGYLTESIYIKGEPEKNIFLLGKSLLGTAKIEKLSTGCCEFLCFKSQNGALAVSLGAA